MSDFLKNMKESLESGKQLDDSFLDKIKNINIMADQKLNEYDGDVSKISKKHEDYIKDNERKYTDEEIGQLKKQAEEYQTKINLEEGYLKILSNVMNIDSRITKIKQELEELEEKIVVESKNLIKYSEERVYTPSENVKKMFEEILEKYKIDEI